MDEQQKPVVPGTFLLQNSTDSLVEVDQDNVETAVRSGLYSPKKDAEFVVLDPYGEKNIVTGEYLDQVLKDGFTLESSTDRYDRELQEQYGGVAGKITAGVSSGLSGASFGITDVAAATNPELINYIKKSREANPATSATGEIVSMVGATMLAPGSAAGRILGSGIRATEAAGALAAKQVTKALTKEGVKAGLAKATAQNVAAKMTQYGVEGSIIATGQLVSESALGKADFNAENLAMALGTGAVIGGSLGAAMGLGKAITPGLKSAAKPVLDVIDSFTSREKAAADVVGWTAKKAATIKEKNPALFKDLPDFLAETGLKAGDDVDDLLSKVSNVQKQAGKNLGEQIDRYDALLAENADLIPNKNTLFKELASQIDDNFMKLKSGTPEAKAALKAAGNYYDELIKSSFEGGTLSLRGLQEARQSAYKLGRATSNTLEGQMAKYAARFYSNTLKNVAEQLSERTGSQDIFAAFLKDHKTYSYASEILPDLIKKSVKKENINPLVSSILGGAAGGLLGEGDVTGLSLGAMAGLAGRSLLKSDILKNLVVMGKIEAAQQGVRRSINSAIKSYSSSKPSKAAKYASLSVLNSVFAQKYENEKYKKPKTITEAYSNMHENLQRYAQDPEQFMRRVNKNTSVIYNSAPETSTQLDSLAIRGAQFLASKIPQKTSADTTLDAVFRKTKPPSKIDLAKFERYLTAVEEPYKVFDAIETGRLSREHVEALQVVYPNIYEQIQTQAMEFVGKNPQMSYNKKLQLGLLLDIPTDESLLPQNILGLQSAFAQQAPEAAGAVQSTVGGLQNINSADRAQTSTQASQENLYK